MSHWERAACTNQQALFFPKLHEAESKVIVREAKAKQVCTTCPVLAECRTEAYAHPNQYVDLVMGGETYLERRPKIHRSSRSHSKMQRQREAKKKT